MSAPLESLSKFAAPLLLTGRHALSAHGCLSEIVETECAISTDNESLLNRHLAALNWTIVYRTPFFAKFRLLSTGTPVIKANFLDPTTFERLVDNSVEFSTGEIKLRMPSLLHFVAMKLHGIKNEPARSVEEIPEILTLLRVNAAAWKHEELEAACRRFGPPAVYSLIKRQLSTEA